MKNRIYFKTKSVGLSKNAVCPLPNEDLVVSSVEGKNDEQPKEEEERRVAGLFSIKKLEEKDDKKFIFYIRL